MRSIVVGPRGIQEFVGKECVTVNLSSAQPRLRKGGIVIDFMVEPGQEYYIDLVEPADQDEAE